MPGAVAYRSCATLDGRLRGVEAVVDKDRTSALLAASVKADALLLLTDVAGVEDGYGTPGARPIRPQQHRRAPPARPARRVDGSEGRSRL